MVRWSSLRFADRRPACLQQCTSGQAANLRRKAALLRKSELPYVATGLPRCMRHSRQFSLQLVIHAVRISAVSSEPRVEKSNRNTKQCNSVERQTLQRRLCWLHPGPLHLADIAVINLCCCAKGDLDDGVYVGKHSAWPFAARYAYRTALQSSKLVCREPVSG